MDAVLNFVINEIFGQGAIFLALIALIGLILQKKPVSEIVRGTIMTARDGSTPPASPAGAQPPTTS